ncbi:MAG: repeat-containing protein, partial [Xanthobacteraceae bacterium]|nr:repeat-containing protein [Xanthobacteraceae bacterium]
MNAPFIIAQATVGSAANSTQHVIKIAKPQGEQAISLRLDNTARLDLSDIGNEKVTFVHVGDRLVILFDNQATVTIAGFFDDSGKPFQNLNIEVEGGRVIVGSEFATLFPITDDASILPAAGNAGAPNSGASFHDATVEGFGTRSALGLLSGEGGNGAGNGNVENLTNTVPRIGAIALGNADDEGLSEGLIGGPGDVPGEAVSITISLNVDFGQDLTGRTLAFAATQPGLTGLTSGGQAISLALTVIAGLPALVGYTGVDPSDPTRHVFTITLDTTPLNGEYTFTLLQPLDHPIAGTEDTVTLSIDFIATDGNGDFANGTFQVAVNDDSPVAGPVTTGLTSEDGGMPASVVDASLEISWGADRSNTGPGLPGDRSVGFTETDPALAGNNVAVNGTSSFAGPLTSNGELVRYTFIGDVLVGYVGLSVPLLIGDTSIVFTVTLSDAGALDKGTYTFDLRQPLDHPAPDGTQHYLDLTFTFTAVDSDGDSIDGSFKVEIDANGVILDAGATIDYSALTEGVFINLANSPQIGPGVFPGIQLVDANTATDHDGAAVKVVGIDRLGEDIVNATGGSGDDVIIGGQEANILRGQDGDDTMRGMGGDDTLEGGKGDDFLRGDGGDDTLRGGDDNDQLVGNGGDDKLYGDAGHDLLDGGRGNDELHGGQGDDDLYGGRGNDKLYGGRGSDILYGGRGDDILDGGRGHDFLDGGRGDDILFGGRGDDLLFGGRGDDDLFGGDGDDRLAGEEGNDNLFGGADRDQLAYVFDLGVFSWDYDVFVGGETGDDYDTAILDGSFYWNDHLTITLTGFESFTADYTDIAGIEVTASEIERIWVLDDPLGGNNDHLLIEGSGGADHIIVTSNFLQEGLAGETVIASIGYEEVRIEGKGGADIIDASDYFYGGVVLRGNGGDDQIVGSDQADDIRGGAGDDTIDGGDGADLFTYDVGDGQDTVRGGGGNDLQEIYGSATSETFNVNAITLGGQQFVGINILDGIAVAQDVDATSANYEVATRDVEDIYIQTGAGADKVIVSGSLGGTGLATSTITIEDGNGNSGDTVDARGLTSNHSIEFIGHDGDDTLFVSGAGGNDTFIGGNGTDTINFRGVGHGVSVDLGNTQAQDTGDGRDTIDGVENAVGSNFNDTLAGDDDANVLTGLDGNDTIRGGLGNDTVEGGTGDDTFNYAIGDGVDTIEGGEGNEILGDKLVLTGTDGDQSITLKATAVGFNVDAGGAAGDEIVTTNVERAVLNLGAANDSLTVVGLNSGETITLVGNTISGTNLPTTTVTGAESVTTKGEGGNDTIDASRFGVAPTAGPGLAGSSAFGAFGNGWARFAAQTFVATGEALSELTFGLNNLTGQVDFRVVIVAWDEANHKPLSATPLYESGTLLYTTGGATNFTVAPGVTLTPGQTYAFVLDFKTDGETLQGNAYIPTYSDANGTQPGGLYYSTSGGGREDALSNVWVASAAGNTDFAYQLTYAGHTVAGLTLDGGAGNDTIMGSAGNDTIYGGADNDTITGGKGNDTIDGGTGDDTSNYAIGDGVDTIEGGQGTDTLVVAGDANAQSLTLTATTSGFTLDTDGVAGAEITASNVEIATLNMAGGTDALTVAGLDTGETITLSGTAASFTVTGTNFPNTTVTNDEAITVNGNGGNDIIDASGLNPFVPVTAGTALGPQPNRLAAFGEGPGTIPYIAQTFVAKSAVLDQLSFTLGNSFGPDAVDFHVLIVAWDTVNNHPVAGAPLYESTTLSAAVSMGAQTFNFTVAPHLALTPAKTYAFVVDAFVARDAINGFAEVPLVTGALAAEQGGLFLISGDLATRDANFAVGWTGNSTVYDLAYQLSYQGVQTLGVTLNGGAGDDTITGSTGNDTISGGADNDIINYVVGTGHDVVDGGTGNDKLNVIGANDAETYNVNAMTLNSQTYLGINILAGANNNVQATALNYEVATKAVEDIFITTNGGGDTVNVTGSLNGTGLAQSTIHIDTGA